MNLAEAIKILSRDLIPNYPYAIGPKARAIQLSIEALKYVRDQYDPDHQMMRHPLPGETRD